MSIYVSCSCTVEPTAWNLGAGRRVELRICVPEPKKIYIRWWRNSIARSNCRCLVHLVFFFFGACQCFVRSESPNLHRHQKSQKKQTTRCTKPAQAPKKTKKLKFPGTIGPLLLLSSCWIFCFFYACRCLVHLVVCFCFVFFGACQCFCISHVKIMMKKVCFTRVLDPPNA